MKKLTKDKLICGGVGVGGIALVLFMTWMTNILFNSPDLQFAWAWGVATGLFIMIGCRSLAEFLRLIIKKKVVNHERNKNRF